MKWIGLKYTLDRPNRRMEYHVVKKIHNGNYKLQMTALDPIPRRRVAIIFVSYYILRKHYTGVLKENMVRNPKRAEGAKEC